MATTAPGIERQIISEDILQQIYASDQDIYPAPLTYERLKSWALACPELSICFQSAQQENDAGPGRNPLGVIIVLPVVKKYWDDLLVGKLKEVDVDPTTMFAKDAATEVGLHVFHVERFKAFGSQGKLRYFAEFALESARDVAENRQWKVLGYSALTATTAGRNACTRMGFRPTGYEEVFITAEASSTASSKVKMICVYPDNEKEFRALSVETDSIQAKTEMVVRHSNQSFLQHLSVS